MTDFTVHAVLLKGPDGYAWGVLAISPDGVRDIVDVGLVNCDAAKSAAWAFAQQTGAVFVPAKRSVK